MTMYEMTAVLWRRRRLLATLAVGFFLIGGTAVLASRSTSYTARAEVLFDQPDLVGNVSGINVPGKFATLLPTFCRMVSGDELVEAIASHSDTTPAEVRSAVRCAAVPETTIAAIWATTGDAERSLGLAAAASETLVAAVDARYAGADVPAREQIDAELLRAARRPAPDADTTVRNLMLVAVGAVFASAAFAVAAEPHRGPTPAEGPVDTGDPLDGATRKRRRSRRRTPGEPSGHAHRRA